jgi:hypothetical protein
MNRLRLDPDELTVTTFATAAEVAGTRGTVEAQGATSGITCATSCAGGPHCTCIPA